MSGECSICLSSFKEPVCIPCGHIYCTQCLADFVNAPDNESMKASCPTCRAQFNLSTPDLTYLPKKYHEYIVSSVRRVYPDSPRYSDMKRELKVSKEKIKKLEKDKEMLMQQCERYMVAARAQAEGERAARQKASDLQSRLHIMEEKFHVADVEAGNAIGILKYDIGVTRTGYQTLEKTYADLRRRYEKLKTRLDQSRESDLSVLAQVSSTSRVEPVREVRPLPARDFLKPKARPASPPPVYVNKRQRLVPHTGQNNIEN